MTHAGHRDGSMNWNRPGQPWTGRDRQLREASSHEADEAAYEKRVSHRLEMELLKHQLVTHEAVQGDERRDTAPGRSGKQEMVMGDAPDAPLEQDAGATRAIPTDAGATRPAQAAPARKKRASTAQVEAWLDDQRRQEDERARQRVAGRLMQQIVYDTRLRDDFAS